MNWHIVSWLMLVALLQDGTATSQPEQLQKSDVLQKFDSDWPVGDPRRCQEQLRQSKFDVKRFEVMPGIGWDNLRNVEAGLVATFNYTRCEATDDGRFLIPDNVFTVPIKFSSVETFAELYDHWLSTSSTTSNTINIQAGLKVSSVSVSGQFSYEHEQVKSKQIEDKAITTRIQMRYSRYEARLQPDPELSPEFKKRLLSIAANIQLNYTEHAMYEGQLLVRDFGTHVLTSVTAGAALVKDDFLQREYVLDHAGEKTSILAAASASFSNVFKASASYGHKTDKARDEKYESMTTHSYIKSHGGPLYKAGSMTLDEWTDGVDENLVPINRAGDPLYFLVTPTLLPELPSTTVDELEKIVKRSIELYYEMNTIRGCTKLGSPNFSFSANFDDGSCNSKPTDLTFGGVYQQCATTGQFLNDDPCTGLKVVNPKTGSYSCPPSYTPVELQSGRRNGHTETITDCHRCKKKKKHHCCHDSQVYSEAVYSTYWCAATGHVEKKSGYLFGGLYTSTNENVVTGAMGCPANFYAAQMFTDLNICISDDFEFGEAFSVPFGGFFSCKSGNPLAAAGVHPVGSNKVAASNSLRSFMAKNGNSWPSKCPEGYSQHIATDDLGCSIHYCVQTGALSAPALPPIKRPPFMNKPATILEQNDNLVMFNVETGTWMKNEKAITFENTLIDAPSKQGNSSGKEMSPGVVAGNPLIAADVHPVGSNKVAASISLRSFMVKSGNSWPSKCPEGYSQHIATDDLGYSIHYCVQTGALSAPALPPVKEPPFMNKPATILEQNDNLVMFNIEAETWMKNEKAITFQNTLIGAPSKQGNSSGKEMSPGVVAAISVVATLGCIGFAIAVIVVVRRRQSRQRIPYRRLTDESYEPLPNYGSTTPESAVIDEAA